MDELRLIFNGDDFGRDVAINKAIVQAHERGVLTSASLMVTGKAVDDAVARARGYPNLAVGLHLVVSDGKGLTAAAPGSRLADAWGRLPRNPLVAGMACFCSPALRAELRREIVAQFERFLATGLPLAHVDGHYFMHLHPVVLGILIPLAEQYGVPGTRLPRDDLRLNLALDGRRAAGKVAWALAYALLSRLALRRLRQSPVQVTDRVYGLLQTGRMHEEFVVGLIRRMPPGVRSAELYFHPSTQAIGEPFGPNPGDLAALLSPRVRQAVAERGAQLTSYAALGARTFAPRRTPS